VQGDVTSIASPPQQIEDTQPAESQDKKLKDMFLVLFFHYRAIMQRIYNAAEYCTFSGMYCGHKCCSLCNRMSDIGDGSSKIGCTMLDEDHYTHEPPSESMLFISLDHGGILRTIRNWIF